MTILHELIWPNGLPKPIKSSLTTYAGAVVGDKPDGSRIECVVSISDGLLNLDRCLVFPISREGENAEIVFYISETSDRWYFRVPIAKYVSKETSLHMNPPHGGTVPRPELPMGVIEHLCAWVNKHLVMGNKPTSSYEKFMDIGRREKTRQAERYISTAPRLTPYQNELMTILIEECAEVIKAATKIQRFGLNNHKPGELRSNAEHLALELGDLSYTRYLIVEEEKLLDGSIIYESYQRKKRRLEKYLQHRPGG